ncbi:peptide chain release factor N(5)-glutamine methyltransferase [Leptospira semungkisensis]|uniref:Release factor glutamine methyltransferase n=1 Tax=Leptospira semungkisensis TaxID=2484985 RepID=A0A4R9G9K7_9LEPT|nr:peptide chain release factor N(5)-glutamine methyltransferase [Leptospira semungkisensis]TGK07577.1 peptide chain release factor N(5)-glutamine methyltransferase [Leptospira semungkisensis]
MADSQDNVLTLLKKSEEFLKKKNIPSARLDAEILLADLLKIQRVKLYVDFERPLSVSEKDEYRERIVQRSKFRPTAYIIGRKAFFDSEFQVNESVLIPRPETEELVAWVLEEYSEKASSLNALDLCSGSGCIGISLAKARQNWQVSFSDLSAEALEINRKNIQEILNSQDRSELFQGDLFSSLPPEKTFDLIVSNPPYIPESEKPSIMPDVAEYEPHLALFVQDFENFHKRILIEALPFLKPSGTIYLETHPKYAGWLKETALSLGYSEAISKKDLSGRDSFVRLKRA